jgi:hypothetical protein
MFFVAAFLLGRSNCPMSEAPDQAPRRRTRKTEKHMDPQPEPVAHEGSRRLSRRSSGNVDVAIEKTAPTRAFRNDHADEAEYTMREPAATARFLPFEKVDGAVIANSALAPTPAARKRDS